MLFAGTIFVGVDTTAAHKAFTYAALDRDLAVATLGEAEPDELLDFLGGQKAAVVAINAPSHLNTGYVRKASEQSNPRNHNLRGVDLRAAEHALRERGISVSATSSREGLCPAWVRMGLSLYRSLGASGFQPYPARECEFQWVETHPHAAFCGLLGRNPLSKATVEGRLQRQLVLFERGLRIRDPMDYFEEITRHRLLSGILPSDLVYAPEQLDALVAALTAWVAVEKKSELSQFGNEEEGFISLPVSSMLEKY